MHNNNINNLNSNFNFKVVQENDNLPEVSNKEGKKGKRKSISKAYTDNIDQ